MIINIDSTEEWKEMMNKSFAANVIKNEHAPPSAHTSRTSSTLVSSYASSIPSSSSSSFPTTTLPSSSSAQLSQSSNANRAPIAQKSSGSSSSYNAPQRIVDDYHRMKRNIPVENENRQVHFHPSSSSAFATESEYEYESSQLPDNVKFSEC